MANRKGKIKLKNGDVLYPETSWDKVTGRPSSLPADGGNSDTVNNHTVNSDVPANAKFTDTTYSAGTGLSLSGTTFNHINSVTAVTAAGLYKVKYDAQGHITGTTAVAKKDITDLGIPSSDTNTTYTIATGDSNGQIKVTPSSGSAYNVSVKGLGSAAYTASTAYASSSHTHDDRYYTETEVDTKLDGKLDKIGKSANLINYVSGNGSYGYAKLATITISSSYMNKPLTFEVSGRGRKTSHITVLFGNVNNTDPSLISFTTDDEDSYFIKKVATSQWSIYTHLSELWGNAEISRVYGDGTLTTGLSIDYTVQSLSALPEGCTRVTRINAPLSHNHDNVYLKLTGGKITGALTVEDGAETPLNINYDDDDSYALKITDTSLSNKPSVGLYITGQANSNDVKDIMIPWKNGTLAMAGDSQPANGGNSATVNNHTVNSDVPANAKFTDTTYSAVSKTAAGLCPALPNETTTTKYLRQDGTWQVPPNTTYSNATTSAAGLMSAADKTKLNGIAEGANNYTHPTSHPATMITGLATVATSGKYSDLSGKPTIPAADDHKVHIDDASKNTIYKLAYIDDSESGNVYLYKELSSGLYVSTDPSDASSYAGLKFCCKGSIEASAINIDGSAVATQDWVTDRGYITGITKAMVTSALGYTPPTTDTNTWKANSSSSEGYVASGAGKANKVWKTDANGNPAWRDDANTTYSNATTSAAGLMSSTDKSKLDGIASGANNYTHPTSHPASMITGLATVATSGSYNDLSNKPTIPTVPGYGASATKIGTSSAGSATTVSRSDHVHAIDLATGDSNGQVKIAGTNVSVKGLGSAAYTASTAYASSSHTHDDRYYTESEIDAKFAGNANIIWLEENGSTTAGKWLAKTSKISALADGQLFLYKIAVDGASTTTLEITIASGSLGAKTIYRSGTSKLTTHFGVGNYVLLAYNELNTCFRVVNFYDTNNYAYVRQYRLDSVTTANAANLYPLLARRTLTNTDAYVTDYSNYRTDVYINGSTGALNAVSLSENGTALSSKYLGINAKASSAGNADTVNGLTVQTAVPANAKFTDTTYSAGSGLSLSGTTFNHSNSVTAVTTAGLYKVKYDAQGHITGTTAVAKSDITGLGIPGSDTTYSVATTSANGLMSSADKTKLNGIAEGANNYSLPTATSSVLGGVKSSTTGTTSGKDYNVQINADGTMKVNVPWTDSNTWKANSSSSEGYVSSGSGQANKVWKTDANGNPAWRDDANSWRGIQNNLTSDSTTDSLSAAQGKVLNTSKLNLSGGNMTGKLTITTTENDPLLLEYDNGNHYAIELKNTGKTGKPTWSIDVDDTVTAGSHEWTIPNEDGVTFASRSWVNSQGFGKGTVKKVNNTSPDANGNVNLTIPSGGNINTTERGTVDLWLVGVQNSAADGQAVKTLCNHDPSDPSDLRDGVCWSNYNNRLEIYGDLYVSEYMLVGKGVDAPNIDSHSAKLSGSSDRFYVHPSADTSATGYKGKALTNYLYEVVPGGTGYFSITYCSSSTASPTSVSAQLAYIRPTMTSTTATSIFCRITYLSTAMAWTTISCYVGNNKNNTYISGVAKVRMKTNEY